MTGLVDRLRSALDEAERIAQAATSWRVVFGTGKIGQRQRLTDFANANDPAHVLRTIQAHREIVSDHDSSDFPYDPEGSAHGSYSWQPCCVGCGEPEPCKTLRLIAAIYLPDIETGDTA